MRPATLSYVLQLNTNKRAKNQNKQNGGQGHKVVAEQKNLFPNSSHYHPCTSITMKSLLKRMEEGKPLRHTLLNT